MKLKVCALAALFCGTGLSAQRPATQTTPNSNPAPAQAPPQGSSSSSGPETLREKNYVRRFSIGASFSGLILPIVPDKTTTVSTDAPPVNGTYSTSGFSKRFAFGVTGQILVTSRFAFNVGLFRRSASYQMSSDVYYGIDNPATPDVDERTRIQRFEDTRGYLYDLPVVVRFYGKARTKPGPRWFLDGGGAFRRASDIKNSVTTTINTGTPTTDTTPLPPQHRTSHGLVAGFGVQLIDPIGIRVIPEVRYTRWMDQTWNTGSTVTERNQIEGVITISF